MGTEGAFYDSSSYQAFPCLPSAPSHPGEEARGSVPAASPGPHSGKPLTSLRLAPRCCLAHDCCYERLKQLGCQPVLNGYQFHIVSRTVVCELPSL